jgi:hypothetical protein
MSNFGLRSLKVAGSAVCFVASIFAQPTTSITLTSAPNGNLGGVFTSPYVGTVGGQTNVPIICDDYQSDTYINESWTAYVTNLSALPSGLVRWNSGFSWNGSTWVAGGLSQTQAYTVAAYLATEIMNAGSGTTLQKDLSFSLWGLFDAPTPFQAITNPDNANAQQYLRDAENAVKTLGLTIANYSNVTIYSYDAAAGAPTCPGGTCPPPPQEFLRVSMDEPSYASVLAMDLFAVVGLMVVLRRRFAGAIG